MDPMDPEVDAPHLPRRAWEASAIGARQASVAQSRSPTLVLPSARVRLVSTDKDLP